ncbi:SDR family NAD(P)-dependent oxidoreductase [Castellaniella sp.]|uniref:SDR family NAD(P)-dependent oxidoreductase n=1 Tax=Castellaniella sp. TaxID=1955812 RepID=UPI00355F6013
MPHNQSHPLRTLLIFLYDLLAVVLAWCGAMLLRFNFDWPAQLNVEIVLGLMVLVPVQLVTCQAVGLYRGMWAFASLPDLRRLLRAVLVSFIAMLLYALLVRRGQAIPRSIVVLYPMLLLGIMAGGRIAWRMWREARQQRRRSGDRRARRPVVVVGAGRAGALLLHQLAGSPTWAVVALVDDDRNKWGLELSGVRVAGGRAHLPALLRQHGARDVILAVPSSSTEDVRKVSEIALEAGARLTTVPSLAELLTGRVAINAMRPVRIQDLLGRDAVQLDVAPIQAMLAGRRVLVTGAGGSIGGELCRQLARFGARSLVLADAGEFALYGIQQWFAELYPEVSVTPLTLDVKDAAAMQAAFARWRPHLVFHAAAYKHVPLMEVHNSWAALRNNAWGTLVAARCARDCGAERFVLISTDKAVNPTNVMGASKRLAEMLCEELAARSPGPGAPRTLMQIVRFGNVLGSTGSVIPKFEQQIRQGGPVTVTHPEITRFFMSIPEAAQLVLQAAAMGRGGELFVLDMGEPVKIVDLARRMIELAGFTPDEIAITYTGLRPGEKLYEEVLADGEKVCRTPHPKLHIARPDPVPAGLLAEAEAWLAHWGPRSDAEVRAQLQRWVAGYQPAAAPGPDADTPLPAVQLPEEARSSGVFPGPHSI